MHHIFLVQEEGAEVDAACRQHSFVGLEVHPVHNKGAVTQQALLALAIKLLQNLPAVPGKLHRPEGSRTAGEAGRQEQALWSAEHKRSHTTHEERPKRLRVSWSLFLLWQ